MCRLLGYVTRTPTTLVGLLGEQDLAAFIELSRKHGDGWGFARAGAGTVEVHKAPEAAHASGSFARIAREDPADLAMVHLRWATLGLPVVSRNAHPFTDGRIAFAHNGSIRPPAALEDLLTKDVAPLLRGDTDSERFFLAVLSRLAGPVEDSDAVASAYAQAVTAIASGLAHSSLNSMLVTPTHLFAVCRYDVAEELREEEPEYYRLRYRVLPQGVVVASSGWGRGWQDLANGQMLVVERATLALSIRSIALETPRATG